jgi:hypothetical protein
MDESVLSIVAAIKVLVIIGSRLHVKGDLTLAGFQPSLVLAVRGRIGGKLILPHGYDTKLLPPTLVVDGAIGFE